jgi:hypothetical protein
MREKIQSLDILSCVKIGGLVTGLFGFAVFLVFAAVMSTAAIVTGQMVMLAVAAVFAIAAPLFYAAYGAIYGAVASVLYNLFAKFLGGVEIEIREVTE